MSEAWPEVRVLKPGIPLGCDDRRKLFVVWFDPGETTGWCVFRMDLDRLLQKGFREVAFSYGDPSVFAWAAGSFTGPESYQAELMMALCRGTWMYGEGVFDCGPESDWFVVGLESFTLWAFSSDPSLLSPPRVSAAFDVLSWRAPFPRLWQGPRDAGDVTTDARLKALNLWSGVAGKDGEHQRDATKHAILQARKFVEPEHRRRVLPLMPWLGGE